MIAMDVELPERIDDNDELASDASMDVDSDGKGPDSVLVPDGLSPFNPIAIRSRIPLSTPMADTVEFADDFKKQLAPVLPA